MSQKRENSVAFAHFVNVMLQSLNADLEETLQEKEDLKNQVQDYIVEVKRAEDLIASKVIPVCQRYFNDKNPRRFISLPLFSCLFLGAGEM